MPGLTEVPADKSAEALAKADGPWRIRTSDQGIMSQDSGRAEPVADAPGVAGTLQVMLGDRKFMLSHEEIPAAAKMENVQAVARLVEQTAGAFYR